MYISFRLWVFEREKKRGRELEVEDRGGLGLEEEVFLGRDYKGGDLLGRPFLHNVHIN